MNWRERLALAAYSATMVLLQPLLKAKLARRAKAEPGYGMAVPERFGVYGAEPVPHHAGPTVWVHAVSLGETRAAVVLIHALRRQQPGMRLLFTHTTATGREEGARCLQPGDLQAWLPWDTQGAVGRFLTHFQPHVGVLMETEVWPGLVQGSIRQGVPLMLVNARLNLRSQAQALRLAWLSRPAYAGLSAVGAQTDADAQRLRSVGAQTVAVWGNLKFDARPDPVQRNMAAKWRRHLPDPVVMLASSREGEEAQFLKEIKASALFSIDLGAINGDAAQAATPLRQKRSPRIQWLLVPRHPQRFDEVAALIESHGFTCLRRSAWGSSAPLFSQQATEHAQPVVWLGDTLGDMALYYSLSSVALLGGSFEPLGGQNLIEAAACGCPVVMGPHTFNFAQAAEMALEAGAAVRVADMRQGVAAAAHWVANAPAREAAAHAGAAFAQAHSGAAQRTAAAVLERLAAKAPVRA